MTTQMQWSIPDLDTGGVYLPVGFHNILIIGGTPPPVAYSVNWLATGGGEPTNGFSPPTSFSMAANAPYVGATPGQFYTGAASYPNRSLNIKSDVIYNLGGGITDDGEFYLVTTFDKHTPVVTLTSPASGADTTSTPTFAFNFSDPDPVGWGQFGGYQLQVSRVSDGHVMWDTGTQAATSGQQSARAASIVYGSFGTAEALVNFVDYQWRVRVQNAKGDDSGYSGWLPFSPGVGPSAPTSITPAGLQTTLTPHISGVYQIGNGAAESKFQYEFWQNGILLYTSSWITGAIATGATYGGSPALSWATAYTLQVRSQDTNGAIGPWAVATFNTDSPPNAPTMIVPSGGAVVNTSTPTLSWQHNSPTGDAQTKAEILLYDLTAAAWVSGYGSSPKSLTQSTQSHTVTTALTINHQYQPQIRTTGLAAAGAGPYSAATTFTYAASPSVAMTSPTDGGTITAPSFAVTWTFSGGSGTQQDYRVQVFASDGVTSIYDSGVVAGTVLTATVPAGYVHNGDDVLVQLTVRDTLGQSAILSPVAVSVVFTPPDTLIVTATATGSQP